MTEPRQDKDNEIKQETETDVCLKNVGPSTPISAALSKNQLKKVKNREKRLHHFAEKKKRERHFRKEKKTNKCKLGQQEKVAIAERLRSAFNTAPKVVIDCQYDARMSIKEQNRLSHQIRRAYSANRACDTPLHLILANLSENGEFFQICCKNNDGFADYAIDRREECVKDLFPAEELVYLSPDSPNVLTEFSSDKVYVIGGLVDETISKNVSLTFSKSNNITTARLPIAEYFVAEKGSGTYKKVLAINQVFGIILKWYETKDWVKALSVGIPERTGFRPKTCSS